MQGAVFIDDLPSLFVFPNPTANEVVIEFRIKEDTNAEIAMSDLVGRKVLEMLNERMPAGKYKYVTDLKRLDNGMYLLYLRTDYEYDVTRVILNK